MSKIKETLAWWAATRYHVWLLGSAGLSAWAFVEGSAAGTVVGSFLACVHAGIWWGAHRHRERVRDLIRSTVRSAEAQWTADGRPWMSRSAADFNASYWEYRDAALSAALARPDQWVTHSMRAYCGESDTAFATGCGEWPRWEWNEDAA